MNNIIDYLKYFVGLCVACLPSQNIEDEFQMSTSLDNSIYVNDNYI